MTMTTSTDSLLTDEVTSAIAFQASMSQNLVYPLVASMRPSSLSRERVGTYSPLSTMSEISEDTTSLPTQALKPEWSKDFVPVELAESTPVTRKLLDDQRWNLPVELGTAYGVMVADTFDQRMADLWNNAFGSTQTPDSVSLISDSHTNKDSSQTYDNLITTGLANGSDAIKNAQQLMRDFKDAKGNPRGKQGNTMLVPNELEQHARELAMSERRPADATNAANIYMGTYDVIVWDRLTSAVKWFWINIEQLRADLRIYMRVPPEFYGWVPNEALSRIFAAYMRYSQGFVDWRGVVGSTGAS